MQVLPNCDLNLEDSNNRCIISIIVKIYKVRGVVEKVVVLGGAHHKPGGAGAKGRAKTFDQKLLLLLLPFDQEASETCKNTHKI